MISQRTVTAKVLPDVRRPRPVGGSVAGFLFLLMHFLVVRSPALFAFVDRLSQRRVYIWSFLQQSTVTRSRMMVKKTARVIISKAELHFGASVCSGILTLN